MASRTLFKSVSNKVALSKNEAGGTCYNFNDEHALAQYVVTGCFNDTFYASAGEQLDKVKNLLSGAKSEFIAKLAVYAHESGKMKDMPAYLLAELCNRRENVLVSKIFNRIVTNAKMLCNFVQIIRSGQTGRKSFGTFVKNLINDWLTSKTDEQIFFASVGHSKPSLADIIKMTHPKAKTTSQNNMFRYILGFDFNIELLPRKVAQFENFKAGRTSEVPMVDFRLLSNIKMTNDQWVELGINMPWNTLRMNLNTLERNGVFADNSVTTKIAEKLSDKEQVKKFNVFPYQLLTTYQNTDAVPQKVKNALQDAMEVATSNVPKFGDGNVAVCVDISGSMDYPATGYNGSATSKTSCRDVAALIGSVVLRNNDDGILVPFHTSVVGHNLNPRDSIMTNAEKLRRLPSGGTACSSAMKYLNDTKATAKTVIFVSDNMSWADFRASYGATQMATEWNKYKNRIKGAKLVLIDIQPNSSTQVSDSKDVLNVCGFSDAVWDVINSFVNGSSDHFVDTINKIEL